MIRAELLDERGTPTEHFMPGTPLRLHVVLETSGLRGMSLEVVLRNEYNLPVAFYSSNIFNQVPLPGEAGRYECVLTLDSYYLASGEYFFDLQTTMTNVSVDHRVDSAVHFSSTAAARTAFPTTSSRARGSAARPCGWPRRSSSSPCRTARALPSTR